MANKIDLYNDLTLLEKKLQYFIKKKDKDSVRIIRNAMKLTVIDLETNYPELVWGK